MFLWTGGDATLIIPISPPALRRALCFLPAESFRVLCMTMEASTIDGIIAILYKAKTVS